jgi:hypothetical protein
MYHVAIVPADDAIRMPASARTPVINGTLAALEGARMLVFTTRDIPELTLLTADGKTIDP